MIADIFLSGVDRMTQLRNNGYVTNIGFITTATFGIRLR